MARYVRLYADCGFVGAVHESIVRIEGEYSDADLDQAAEDFLNNHVDFGWHEVEPGEEGYGQEDEVWDG